MAEKERNFRISAHDFDKWCNLWWWKKSRQLSWLLGALCKPWDSRLKKPEDSPPKASPFFMRTTIWKKLRKPGNWGYLPAYMAAPCCEKNRVNFDISRARLVRSLSANLSGFPNIGWSHYRVASRLSPTSTAKSHGCCHWALLHESRRSVASKNLSLKVSPYLHAK